MKSAWIFACVALCAGTLLTACGDDDSDGDDASPPDTVPATADSGGATPASTNLATVKPDTGGKVPSDVCSLVSPADLKALAPTAADGKHGSETGAPGQVIGTCHWEWADGIGSLDLRVMTLPAGTTPELVKQSLKAEVKPPGKELSGIGEFAIFTSAINADAEVRFLAKGMLVVIDLSVLGARDKQDLLIALARGVAGKL